MSVERPLVACRYIVVEITAPGVKTIRTFKDTYPYPHPGEKPRITNRLTLLPELRVIKNLNVERALLVKDNMGQVRVLSSHFKIKIQQTVQVIRFSYLL